MGESAKKTAVDASQFEQVVAALMIVGKAELAEIMTVAKKPPVGTKRGDKPGALANAATKVLALSSESSSHI